MVGLVLVQCPVMVVTVIASQSRACAEWRTSTGVAVDYVNYPGVNHTFFGMSAVLADARSAVSRVAADLKLHFSTAGI